ncbi:hypothetical protein [Haloferax mucosum]|nr:hypothetical protein [Haloferax mucosum]
MRDRIRLDWRVPKAEWERFVEHVETEFGSIEGYLGREAEAAMREYADTDGYAGVEKRVDRLVKASGRSSEGDGKEKNSQFNGVPTTRVTVRVDPEVKDDFRAAAKQSDQSYGVTFARAIQTYRDGGRAARLERRLDRVLEDAEKMLEHVSEDSEDDGVSMGKHERCVIAICNELPEDSFVDDELERAIRDIANVHSKPSIREYRQDVIERLEVEPHPEVPHLWVPHEKAAKWRPGVPKECRQPPEHLDSDQRVKRIQLAVGRRAGVTDTGKVRVTATELREHVFEGATSTKTTRELMRSAAQVVGIDLDTSTSPAALQVNLRVLGETNPDLFEEIIDYRDNTDSGLLTSSVPTTMTDFMNAPSDANSGGHAVASDGGAAGPW